MTTRAAANSGLPQTNRQAATLLAWRSASLIAGERLAELAPDGLLVSYQSYVCRLLRFSVSKDSSTPYQPKN